MNLSLSKLFKQPIIDSNLMNTLVFNMVNGHTQEEQIYALRIAFNLSQTPETKA
jgi:hypothetical protein